MVLVFGFFRVELVLVFCWVSVGWLVVGWGCGVVIGWGWGVTIGWGCGVVICVVGVGLGVVCKWIIVRFIICI